MLKRDRLLIMWENTSTNNRYFNSYNLVWNYGHFEDNFSLVQFEEFDESELFVDVDIQQTALNNSKQYIYTIMKKVMNRVKIVLWVKQIDMKF